jgi:hypothetical protein
VTRVKKHVVHQPKVTRSKKHVVVRKAPPARRVVREREVEIKRPDKRVKVKRGRVDRHRH